MYRFSRTPEAPERSYCAANPATGEHEPVELVGTSLNSFCAKVRLDDGGEFRMMPCRMCGLMYWEVEKDVWEGNPRATSLR